MLTGASSWSPRPVCSVTKPRACDAPPASTTTASTAPLTIAAPPSTTARRRRASTPARISAAGQILIQAPIARSTDPAHGAFASHSRPATASGTVTASMRYMPIGPSRARKASQNHAATVRPLERARPTSSPNAGALHAVTKTAQPTV